MLTTREGSLSLVLWKNIGDKFIEESLKVNPTPLVLTCEEKKIFIWLRAKRFISVVWGVGRVEVWKMIFVNILNL